MTSCLRQERSLSRRIRIEPFFCTCSGRWHFARPRSRRCPSLRMLNLVDSEAFTETQDIRVEKRNVSGSEMQKDLG